MRSIFILQLQQTFGKTKRNHEVVEGSVCVVVPAAGGHGGEDGG